jgi:hypothetical protein
VGRNTFFIASAAEPAQLIFDPGKTLLVRLKTDKPQPLWTRSSMARAWGWALATSDQTRSGPQGP